MRQSPHDGLMKQFDGVEFELDAFTKKYVKARRDRKALLEACKCFVPVLKWLESHAEETVGRDLAKQLRPKMEAAIADAESEE